MSRGECLRADVRARVGRLAIDAAIDTAAGPLVITGPNGAGKTSLLLLLLGVLPVEQGRITLGDTVLLDTAAGVDVPLERRRVGYVPQDYALFPHLTVCQNVDFALASAAPHERRGVRSERVDAILRELGLGAQAARYPQGLSGGERQRVALGRALVARPRAVLLDEPLAALDVHARRDVRRFLAAYLETLAVPTVVVTHDAPDARVLGRRIAVLEDGRVRQVGTWAELAAHPASHFVAEFTGQGEAARTAP